MNTRRSELIRKFKGRRAEALRYRGKAMALGWRKEANREIGVPGVGGGGMEVRWVKAHRQECLCYRRQFVRRG